MAEKSVISPFYWWKVSIHIIKFEKNRHNKRTWGEGTRTPPPSSRSHAHGEALIQMTNLCMFLSRHIFLDFRNYQDFRNNSYLLLSLTQRNRICQRLRVNVSRRLVSTFLDRLVQYKIIKLFVVLSYFRTCKCSYFETNLSWTCLISGLLSFEHPSVFLFCLLGLSYTIYNKQILQTFFNSGKYLGIDTHTSSFFINIEHYKCMSARL